MKIVAQDLRMIPNLEKILLEVLSFNYQQTMNYISALIIIIILLYNIIIFCLF